MLKVSLLWLAVLSATLSEGFGDVLRLALVVEEKGEGVEEVTSANGERSLFVKKGAIVGDADVEEAALTPGRQRVIQVRLSEQGGEKLKKATRAMRKGVDRMAIIIDDKLIMAPVVQGVLSRNFEISGLSDLDLGEIDNLARRISGRPLRPEGEELKVVKVETVPFTEEEYQKIKAAREQWGLYYLEEVPGEEQLNKLLRRGMSYDEVINVFGPCSGVLSEPKEENFRLDYGIAPERAPVNPKRETFPSGVSIVFEAGRVSWWGHSYSDQIRAEKLKGIEKPEPGPRSLKVGFPKFDYSAKIDVQIDFHEKIKIAPPKENLTKQDFLDLLQLTLSMTKTVLLSGHVENPSIDSQCDLMKTLAMVFPEVAKLVNEANGERVPLKALDEVLSAYHSKEKELPFKTSKSRAKE